MWTYVALYEAIYVLLISFYCWRFGPTSTLDRLVNLTLRVPAQMG
jgi:hypothetical protein